MLLYYGLLSYWLLTVTVAVISHFVPLLATASAYGKLTTLHRSKSQTASHPTLSSLSSSSSSSSALSSISDLVLSRRLYLSNGRCFTVYYSLATLLNAALLHSVYGWYITAHIDGLLLAILSCNRWLIWQFAPSLAFSSLDSHWPPHIAPPARLLIVHVVYQLHFMRRLWECWCVHRFSATSQQHVLVLIFGVMFYVALILSPVIDQLQHTDSRVTQPASEHVVSSVMAVMLYVGGSVWQRRCHRILAELRPTAASRSATSTATYSIPRGSGFSYLLCPHYTAELMIYLSFATMRSCLLQWLALFWTTVNLSITAQKTRHWYANKWPHGDWTSRWTLVPFVM